MNSKKVTIYLLPFILFVISIPNALPNVSINTSFNSPDLPGINN